VGTGVVQDGSPTPGVIVCVGVMVGPGGCGVFVHVGLGEGVVVGVGMGLNVGVSVSVGSSAGGGVFDGLGREASISVTTVGLDDAVAVATGGAVAEAVAEAVSVGVGVGLSVGLAVGLVVEVERAEMPIGVGGRPQALRPLATTARSKNRDTIATVLLPLTCGLQGRSLVGLLTWWSYESENPRWLFCHGDHLVLADPVVHFVPGDDAVAVVSNPVGAVLQ